jgi:hypothetical protein
VVLKGLEHVTIEEQSQEHVTIEEQSQGQTSWAIPQGSKSEFLNY